MMAYRLEIANPDRIPTSHADDYHNCSYLGYVPLRVIPSEPTRNMVGQVGL